MTELAVDMAGLTDPEPPDAEEVPPPSDPWLARRAHGFGASDVAVLMAALGRRSAEDLPRYMQRRAAKRRVRGLPPTPRILLEKARLLAPLAVKAGPAARGSEREAMLVQRWRELVQHRAAGPDAALVDPRSIVYAERDFPREIMPLVDRHCPRLTATPDILARDVLGELGCWDCKCSVHEYDAIKPWHALQLQTQMAVCDGTHGGIVEGAGWAAEWKDYAGEPGGPVVTRRIDRDEALIAEIREATEEAWDLVQSIRMKWEENQ